MKIVPKFSENVPSDNAICGCGRAATEFEPVCMYYSVQCTKKCTEVCEEVVPLCDKCYKEECLTYPHMEQCSMCGGWEDDSRIVDGVCCQCEEREELGEDVDRKIHGGFSLEEKHFPQTWQLRRGEPPRGYVFPAYMMPNVK